MLPGNYLIAAEGFPDSPRIFISYDFFRDPPDGFTIDWSGANWKTEGGICMVVKAEKPCHEQCMKGVVVKLDDPQRVWRLTGIVDSTTRGCITYKHGLEAVWPD